MVVNTFNGYGGVFAVEEGFHLVGPFDEAVVAAVEVVLEADAGGVVGLVDAVEVEVVEWFAVVCPVYVEDGESGGGHVAVHAEVSADFLDKGGLAGAHLAEKAEHALLWVRL